MQGAVSASDVEYVVLDVPKYRGPVIFPDHPTWVPIAPNSVRHDRQKSLERLQLPLVLAWGMTIHKSQGLTFPDGVVVDFKHAPNTRPLSTVGLGFVAMSRATHWERQAFRASPSSGTSERSCSRTSSSGARKRRSTSTACTTPPWRGCCKEPSMWRWTSPCTRLGRRRGVGNR